LKFLIFLKLFDYAVPENLSCRLPAFLTSGLPDGRKSDLSEGRGLDPIVAGALGGVGAPAAVVQADVPTVAAAALCA